LLEGVWKLKGIRRNKVKGGCLLLLGKEHETRITGLSINKEWRRECLNKEDRHFTYNITLRRSHASIVAVEKQ
jgi:hypothetical protein